MGKTVCLLAALAVVLVSCGHRVRTDGYTPLPPSTGSATEIVAVVDSSFLSPQTRAELYRCLSPVISGLPQKERLARLYIIPRSSFSRTYRTMRNLVLLEQSDSLPGLIYSKDVYAQPQNVFTIKAPDESALREQLAQSGLAIFDTIRHKAIKSLQDKFSKITNQNLKAVSGMGIQLSAPNYYHVARSEKDFVWLTREVSRNGIKGSVNLLVYKSDSTGQKNWDPIVLRDTMTRRYVPGQAPGSYAVVDRLAVPPQTVKTGNADLPSIFTYGFWRTQGDFMGGAFINHTIVDESTRTAYCADGFVYLPFEEKGAYILEIEAILRTLGIQSPVKKEKKL